jgi:hypothetical protein
MASAPAQADASKLVAGSLTCKGQETVGLVLASQQSLACTYVPAGKSPKQSSSATSAKIGLDIGVKGESTIV